MDEEKTDMKVQDKEMTTVTIEMDKKLKEEAEALFEELGMSIPIAFNIFVRQTLREGKIPFEIGLYQPKEEARKLPREEKRSTEEGGLDLDALFADLMNED